MPQRYGSCYTKLEATCGANMPHLGGPTKKTRKAAAQRRRKEAKADANRANSIAESISKTNDNQNASTEWNVVKKPEVKVVPRKKGMCKIIGHFHKIKDCPNNPKSKKYCGIPYEEMKCKEVTDGISRDVEGEGSINDDTMPRTNNDDDQRQSVATNAHDRGVPVPLANESNAGNTNNEESTTKKKRRARNKQQLKCRLKGHNHIIKDCPNNPRSKNYCGIPFTEIDKEDEIISKHHDILVPNNTVETPIQGGVYEDPSIMSNKLRQHLSHLQIKDHLLPMDMSKFYEKYFLSSDKTLDVHRSTFHTLTAFLQAMELEQLIVLQKTWHSNKKYRKDAKSKVVVVVGKERVKKYLQSRKGRTMQQKKKSQEDELEDDVTGAIEEMNEVETERQVHQSKAEINEKLKHHLASLQVNKDDLPIEVGSFYTKYKFDVDIRKSKYRSVVKFMQAMEKEGIIVLKKMARGRLVVVAAGRDQVSVVKRGDTLEPAVVTDQESDRELSTSDDESTEEYDHIDIRHTIHAKERQKSRAISDTDIKRVICESKKSIKRGKDGVRTISEGNITAVVACGGKNKVITTWRDESAESDYLERWTNNDAVALNADDEVMGKNQKIVTISETFERHVKATKRRYTPGELVIKNNKKRKNFMVVGLDSKVIDDVAKDIRHHIGCRATIGKLDMESWMNTHGKNTLPLAKEGSKTITFNLAAEQHVISRVLSRIESVVPVECRRYLREEEEGDLFFIREIVATTGASVIDEKEARQIYSEIMRLFKLHCPSKLTSVPGLWKKYQGRENELLFAIK